MNFLSIIILPLFGIITIIGILIYFIRLYNKLKSLDNSAEATLSQVRVALKKRLDTIEQLLVHLHVEWNWGVPIYCHRSLTISLIRVHSDSSRGSALTLSSEIPYTDSSLTSRPLQDSIECRIYCLLADRLTEHH